MRSVERLPAFSDNLTARIVTESGICLLSYSKVEKLKIKAGFIGHWGSIRI